jgi:di/tricarboxylate transporter
MTNDQILILFILIATMAMFLWGRWRHDMVAVGALLACVIGGLVAPGEAFSGFGHPAVVTVACVLVLSRGLQMSGAVDVLTRYALPTNAGPTLSLAALVALGAVLSGFMNNVGALALLMPVAIQLAGRLELPPGRVLMPLAFGTILGGMTTLIGTPPNLIVSGFRAENGANPFGMFDFTPVGLTVAAAGVVLVALIGWRLVPVRERPGSEGFDTGAYITEARVPDKSKAVGLTLREIEGELDEADAQVIGLVRHEVRMNAPSPAWVVQAGDILIVEAEVEALAGVLSNLGLQLEEAVSSSAQEEDEKKKNGKAGETQEHAEKKVENDKPGSDSAEGNGEKAKSMDAIVLMELVVRPESALTGRSASDILLRTRYGLNLLAVSREGTRSQARLRTFKIRPGDLLLMQGPTEALTEFASDFGCIPLAERELRIPDRRMALLAGGIMVTSVATAAFGLLPTAVAFAAGVLASMALHTVPPRSVYSAIDWPVIVLLGALMPVAGAMETTGTADLIARFLLDGIAQGDAIIGMTLILVVTMVISSVVNNAATAAAMCPIAIGTASALGVNADPFLMAVAIGASCAFLTPIGHQNNTLILGPGGFRFGDYWRLGLPVSIMVTVLSIPLLLLVWPL